jgi:hypothetical protein
LPSFSELCGELHTTFLRHFDGQKQTFKNPIIKISSLLPELRPGMLAAPYPMGGKNEKEEIDSLVIACGRPSLTRMRNDSGHGGRYTEHWESREKDSLWRIRRDLNAGVDPLSFLKLPVKSRLDQVVGQYGQVIPLSRSRKQVQK